MLQKILKHINQGTLKIALTRELLRAFKHSTPYIYYFNRKNRINYGPLAPRFAETIWVNPLNVNYKIINPSYGKYSWMISGEVVETFWPVEQAMPITENQIVRSCIDHWVNYIPWKETVHYKYLVDVIMEEGRYKQYKSIEDIEKRYLKMDEIFKQVKRENRLKPNDTIKKNCLLYRKVGSKIHIGPKGELFKGSGGMHRFAMAYILKIKYPAQIGLVHKSAIPYLNELRKNL